VLNSNLSNPPHFFKAYKSNINPRFIEVAIRPPNADSLSTMQLPRNSSLNQAVEMATNSFLKGNIKFFRFNSDGKLDKRIIKYRSNAKKGNYINPVLANGDIIVLGKNKLKLTSEFLNDITGPLRAVVFFDQFLDVLD